jgi:hypothetical protein
MWLEDTGKTLCHVYGGDILEPPVMNSEFAKKERKKHRVEQVAKCHKH